METWIVVGVIYPPPPQAGDRFSEKKVSFQHRRTIAACIHERKVWMGGHRLCDIDNLLY